MDLFHPAWFDTSLTALTQVLFTATGVYLFLIALVRVNGLRTFAKMSSFDFAITVAVGSILATTVTTPRPPLLQSCVALAALIGLQRVVAVARYRLDWFENSVDNCPLLLMEGSRIFHSNLKKGRITLGDLRAKLREANVLNYAQVRAVVLETTGDISVLHADDPEVELSDDILEGIRRE